jgi:predicted histone-like DNA-binding protein
MPVFIQTYQDNRKTIGTHKYYGKVIDMGETLDLETMATHIANHGSIWSIDIVRPVLMKMKDCMLEMLMDSKQVKIDGIGTFYLNVKSTGAESEEEFTCAENIKGLRIRMLPEGAKGEDVTSKSLLSKIKLQKTTGFVQA